MPDLRAATADDMPAIVSLLKAAELPCEDVSPGRQDFIVAVSGNSIVGVVGLERAGPYGLLRSLAVDAGQKGKGLGKALVNEILLHAWLKGIGEVYILTTTAPGFFKKAGFEPAVRAEAPKVIQNTTEFKSICPVSSACMKKKIA
jgi:N-acetylglutamate synthase-like GNAT family acetyltransferase